MGSDKTKTDAPAKTPPSTSDKAKPAPEMKSGPAPAAPEKKPTAADAKAVGGSGTQPAKADSASRLQRSVGNQRANHLAGGEPVPVSHPSDPAEKHAEAVGKDVAAGKKRDPLAAGASTPSPPTMHRAVVPTHPAYPGPGPGKQPTHPVQGQPAPGQPTAGHDAIARAKAAPPGQASHDGPAQSTRDIAPDPGEPIPQPTRGILEHRMTANLSAVRIHRGMHADALARSVHSRAVTKGHDIWLASDASPYDIELMAHEVTHALHGDTGHLHRANGSTPPGGPGSPVVETDLGVLDPAAKLLTLKSLTVTAGKSSVDGVLGNPAVWRPSQVTEDKTTEDKTKEDKTTEDKTTKSKTRSAPRPRQREDWREWYKPDSITGTEEAIRKFPKDPQGNPPRFFKTPDTHEVYTGDAETIGPAIVIPSWNKSGKVRTKTVEAKTVEAKTGKAKTGKAKTGKAKTSSAKPGTDPDPDPSGGDDTQSAKTKEVLDPFQVDHIQELQYGGLHRMENLRLLVESENTSLGQKVRGEIKEALTKFFEMAPRPAIDAAKQTIVGTSTASVTDADAIEKIRVSVFSSITGSDYKDENPKPKEGKWFVTFSKINEVTQALSSDLYWDPHELKEGKHADYLQGVEPGDLAGTMQEFRLYHGAAGGQWLTFNLNPSGAVGKYTGDENTSFGDWRYPLSVEYDSTISSGQVGTFTVNRREMGSAKKETLVTKTPKVPDSKKDFKIYRLAGLDWAAYYERQEFTQWVGDIDWASPVEFDILDFDPDVGLVGYGTVPRPTLKLLEHVTLSVDLGGDGLTVTATAEASQLNLPGPFKVRGGSLSIRGGDSDLAIDGEVDFDIPGLATGRLRGGATNAGGAPSFALDGQLDFDSNMFKPAQLTVNYQDGKWGGGGTLGVPKGLIKGVNEAQLSITFADETFTGKGWVKPAVQALDRADLALFYDPGGDSKLTAAIAVGQGIKGIKGGNLAATITRKQGGAYSLSGDVTIEPDVPGLNATIHGSYDDGLFTVEGHLDYKKGMLAGSVDVGVTNQPVGPGGKPAAPAAPPAGAPAGKPGAAGKSGAAGEHLTLYGSGSLTLQLAPWLQATAGVTLKADGGVNVEGEVAVPDAIELFPEKKFEKELVHVGIDIPIVGVAVAGQRVGIFATVQGGLSAEAGIGPGQLRGVKVHVAYDPEKEHETKVTGNAQVYVPAHAGLKLEIRGGLGAGIPIVSATATLGVSGELALVGAAQADFAVNWSPAKGLAIDAVAEVSAEPRFLFDITGRVDVSADVLVHTFHLYEKEWNFAHFEYGTGLRLGLKLPVHYEQGKPFDIKFSDIQFEYPHIDPTKVLSDLVHKIA